MNLCCVWMTAVVLWSITVPVNCQDAATLECVCDKFNATIDLYKARDTAITDLQGALDALFGAGNKEVPGTPGEGQGVLGAYIKYFCTDKKGDPTGFLPAYLKKGARWRLELKALCTKLDTLEAEARAKLGNGYAGSDAEKAITAYNKFKDDLLQLMIDLEACNIIEMGSTDSPGGPDSTDTPGGPDSTDTPGGPDSTDTPDSCTDTTDSLGADMCSANDTQDCSEFVATLTLVLYNAASVTFTYYSYGDNVGSQTVSGTGGWELLSHDTPAGVTYVSIAIMWLSYDYKLEDVYFNGCIDNAGCVPYITQDC